MNQWLALATAIEKEIEEMPAGRASDKGAIAPQDVVASELYKGEDVDAAVHSFSTSGRWPLLEANEYFFIHLRLRFGVLVARALATPDPHDAAQSFFPAPSADFSMDIQLQWLLNAAWKSIGRGEWAREFLATVG